MSVDISIRGFTGKNSPEFQKHYKAVQFCIENGLSYPKETSEFFKGRVDGGDIEDYKPEYALNKITNGLEVDLPISNENYSLYRLKVADIPSDVEEIIVTFC